MHSKTAKVSVEHFASLYSLSFEGSTYFQSIEVSTIITQCKNGQSLNRWFLRIRR